MSLDVRAHVDRSIVPRVLDAIAQRHTAPILRTLLREPRGFEALVRALAISRSTLTARLGHLVREGLVTRAAEGYAVTPLGRQLFAVLCMMSDWDRVPSGMVHVPCSAPLALDVLCAACDAPVRARDIALPDAPTTKPVPDRGDRTRGLGGAELDALDATALLSDKWTARIVALSFFGVSKFQEMASVLGIATNVLAERLERLVQHGLLEKRVYEERPRRSAYVLTEEGHRLYALVLAMIDFGNRAYRGDADDDMTHRPCGATLRVAFRCRGCRARVRAEDVAGG